MEVHFKFRKIGNEQHRFDVLERKDEEGGVPMIIKVHPEQERDFEEIAAYTTNAQFRLAAGFAGPDGHAVVRDIPLGNRRAAIGFSNSSFSSRGSRLAAYKITYLNKK
ncbi:MAG: hypothetical protein LBE98_02195 [Puniceicoccales bacterium]|jgi:hypothetical protein|nr:hypothetical protein [Puniceicoccales bacterium]